MFTGIIREIGKVTRVERPKGLVRLRILAPKTAPSASHGESVSVDGVCLTVVDKRDDALFFEAVEETCRLTTLGGLVRGAAVNLEPSLSLGERVHGHFVLGHIDGRARVVGVRRRAGERVLELCADPALERYLIPKGSIAMDGVSLTIGQEIIGTAFAVYLIPETVKRTTLGKKRVGARVNIEADYLAKVVLEQASKS